MGWNVSDMAASVHQRLLNKARATGRPFQELLQHFAIERFLYRLSRTSHRDRFVLKGALMLSVWGGPAWRPTRDIDLLGSIENVPDAVAEAMRDACSARAPDDGMSFDPDSVRALRITDDAEYEGVRVSAEGRLGHARVSLQIDVGIGDVVVPAPTEVSYPTLLDFPAPTLSGYSMESLVAEKLQAMLRFGALNSRTKDFYDIWSLSRSFDFEGITLAEAIARTLERRTTRPIPGAAVFSPEFASDGERQTRWNGFIEKADLKGAPESFAEVAEAISRFLRPIVVALAEGKPFRGQWKAGRGW